MGTSYRIQRGHRVRDLTITGNSIAFKNRTLRCHQYRNLNIRPYYSKLISNTKSYKKKFLSYMFTFPIGFNFRKSGVLFVTPISKFSTRLTCTPLYSAAMRDLAALWCPFIAYNTCKMDKKRLL